MSYKKYMIEQGKAYPCFASAEELEEMRLEEIEKKKSIPSLFRSVKERQKDRQKEEREEKQHEENQGYGSYF